MGNTLKTAALYCRLSKEDADKPDGCSLSQSLVNQREMLLQYAEKNGIEVFDFYIDDDFSGTSTKRPAFRQLIDDACEGRFNIVLCKSQSRFTRDIETAEKYLNRVFPSLGIRFIGVVDNVDTGVEGGKKARQINALVNEWYVEDLSENIKSVFKSKMARGDFIGSFAPYGYKKSKTDHNRLEVDSEAAEVVREIFSLCVDGMGVNKICSVLDRRGVPTPSEYKSSMGMMFCCRGGKCWAPSTVKRILTNEVYTGAVVQGMERKESFKSARRVRMPKECWIRVKNCHEPVISEEIFALAQNALKIRRRQPAENSGMSQYRLSGLILCKYCGSAMVRSGARKNGENYLRCGLSTKSHRTACDGAGIKLRDVENAVNDEISGLLKVLQKSCSFKYKLLLAAKDAEGCRRDKYFNDIEKLERKRRSAVLALKKCLEDTALKGVGKALFEELKNELVSEIHRLEQQKADISESIEKLERVSEGEICSMLNPYSFSAAEIHLLVSSIEVEGHGKGVRKVFINWNF
ncbi:recombinase family protein [Lachnospiraceae bacterium NSJ-143]|nr:recombinase family protein [Lachnospiraceae bacterium NSJ-143]